MTLPLAPGVITAACNSILREGDRAYSHYTCSPGVIGPIGTDGWFDFRHDDGKKTLLNGDRICCLRHAREFGYSNAQ